MKTDLIKRTKQFALDVISLVNQIEKNNTNKILSSQLVRAATSIGANYRAALRAKSKADFIYKIKIVEEESDETIYWLELIKETNLKLNYNIDFILKESKELTAIFSQIAITSKNNSKINS
jgi:four helix bundle protein